MPNLHEGPSLKIVHSSALVLDCTMRDSVSTSCLHIHYSLLMYCEANSTMVPTNSVDYQS